MSLSFPPGAAVGTVYQGFVFDGVKWMPNFAAMFVTSINGKGGALGPADVPGVGNRVLLSSAIVTSAVATVDFLYDFDNTYDEYEVDCYNVMADTASAVFSARYSWDGATFDTTSQYLWWFNLGQSNSTANIFGASGSYIALSPALNAGYIVGLLGRLRVPWTTDRPKNLEWTRSGTGSAAWFAGTGCGTYNLFTTPLRGIRFFMSTGNIVRGVFNLHGIVKAGLGAT